MKRLDPFEWDHYKSDVRLFLTALFLFASFAMWPMGLKEFSWIPILFAAIAFHFEHKLKIDPKTRTFEQRIFIRPFGQPKVGKLDEIGHIFLTDNGFSDREEFRAYVVFDGRLSRYRIARGPLQMVTGEVTNLTRATRIPVVESDRFKATRDKYAAIARLYNQAPSDNRKSERP
jgi:hypothetical protein